MEVIEWPPAVTCLRLFMHTHWYPEKRRSLEHGYSYLKYNICNSRGRLGTDLGYITRCTKYQPTELSPKHSRSSSGLVVHQWLLPDGATNTMLDVCTMKQRLMHQNTKAKPKITPGHRRSSSHLPLPWTCDDSYVHLYVKLFDDTFNHQWYYCILENHLLTH